MKLALIPPISLLKYTERTNYQLMLPQLVSNQEYAEVYFKHCQNDEQFVILDNGAAEGIDFDWETLINIAYQFEVDEIVLPDTLGSKTETIDKAERFRDFFLRGHPQSFSQFLWDFKFMFVVQGGTLESVLESGKWAAAQDWIDTIGIPRHMLDTLEKWNARTVIANELTMMGSNKDIHFLGANARRPNEVAALANPGITNQAYVRGMDTSMPFNYAHKKLPLTETNTPCGRPDNYFDLPADAFPDGYLKENLDKFAWGAEGKR